MDVKMNETHGREFANTFDVQTFWKYMPQNPSKQKPNFQTSHMATYQSTIKTLGLIAVLLVCNAMVDCWVTVRLQREAGNSWKSTGGGKGPVGRLFLVESRLVGNCGERLCEW